MSWIVALFQLYLLPLGGAGIFAMTVLDSTFVPMPNIMDVTYIGFCLSHPIRIPYYFLAAVSGSLTGCYLLFSLSPRGSKYVARRLERARYLVEFFSAHGAKTLFVGSLMPPPFPFKLMIMASGLFPISTPRFLLALAAGRGLRYLALGSLAAIFGDAVIGFLKRDFALASLLLVAAMTIVFLLSYLLQRRWMKVA